MLLTIPLAGCDLGPADGGSGATRAPSTAAPVAPPSAAPATVETSADMRPDPSAPAESGLRPTILPQNGRGVVALPPPLVQTIMTVYPGFRVPAEPDLEGAWSREARPGSLPFITWGDYTGDGLADVAAILLGDAGWKVVAFHQTQSGSYDPIVIADGTPGKRDPAGAADPPKNMVLATLRKGEKYATSSTGAAGMELRRELKFGVDAIEVEVQEGSRTFYYWDGKKYESYEFGYE